MDLKNFEAILRLCEQDVVEEFRDVAINELNRRDRILWERKVSSAAWASNTVSNASFTSQGLTVNGQWGDLLDRQIVKEAERVEQALNNLLDNSSPPKKKFWKWGK